MSKLSVVTTLYNSENYIEEFYQRILKTIEDISIKDYEIIFVDDGSPDESLDKAVRIHENDPKVQVIELSRNFGHHKAIMTGLAHADADYIFLIDVDLEEEPELLADFWKELHNKENKDFDIIYGVQKERKGGLFERWSGTLFYKVINFLSEVDIPANAVITKLMTRQFVMELVQFRDRAIFFGGLIELTGFRQKPFFCHKKHKGSTTYSLSIKLNQFVNSVTSFSTKPLHFIFYLGILIAFGAMSLSIYLIASKLFFQGSVSGWTSTITSIYLLGGAILASIGVIGIYISKIFEEVKERPYTVIRKVWSK